MTAITISLTEEKLSQLTQWAKQLGVTPEELLSRQVNELLENPDAVFQKASEYLLQKNAELYRRLA
jgi:antitoxin FitA